MTPKRALPLAALILAAGLIGCGDRVDETELCTTTRYGNVTKPVTEIGWEWTIFSDLTCFPGTQQVYPGGWEESRGGRKVPVAERVSALTPDSVDLTLEYAFEYQIPKATYFDSVFKTKRTPDNFDLAVANAGREGARSAIAGWRSGEAFNRREAFGDSLRASLQRSLGGLARVSRVYVRDMDLPPKVREAREAVFQQNMALDQALKQRKIDSVGNVTKIQNANTEAEVNAAKARVYKTNPELANLEVKKAQAEAFASLLKACQSNCQVGATVLDQFLGRDK
jgi:regulator of protease activity HflC (stomatin/prohibitin superfamily)